MRQLHKRHDRQQQQHQLCTLKKRAHPLSSDGTALNVNGKQTTTTNQSLNANISENQLNFKIGWIGRRRRNHTRFISIPYNVCAIQWQNDTYTHIRPYEHIRSIWLEQLFVVHLLLCLVLPHTYSKWYSPTILSSCLFFLFFFVCVSVCERERERKRVSILVVFSFVLIFKFSFCSISIILWLCAYYLC